MGFDFNKIANLVPLDQSRHLGSHSNYTDNIEELIKRVQLRYPNKNAKEVLEHTVNVVINSFSQTTGKINDIPFSTF